ncbi:hypothetical protein ABK040_005987 [Willaertia magna]
MNPPTSIPVSAPPTTLPTTLPPPPSSSRHGSSSHHREHRSSNRHRESSHHHGSNNNRHRSSSDRHHHSSRDRHHSSSSSRSNDNNAKKRKESSTTTTNSKDNNKRIKKEPINNLEIIKKVMEHPLKEITKSSFLCNMKFQTALPTIDLDPILLEYPIDNNNMKYISYKTTSLEKNHKYELLTEPNMGININLINSSIYKNVNKLKLNKKDEELLLPIDLDKEIQDDNYKPSWLKTPTYFDAKKGSKNIPNSSIDKKEIKKIKKIKKKFNLLESFELVKKIDEKVENGTLLKVENENKKAIQSFPIIPDFNLLNNTYIVTNFGGDYIKKDALLLIKPNNQSFDEDKTIELAQYYEPTGNKLLNMNNMNDHLNENIDHTVELVRNYNGMITNEEKVVSLRIDEENGCCYYKEMEESMNLKKSLEQVNAKRRVFTKIRLVGNVEDEDEAYSHEELSHKKEEKRLTTRDEGSDDDGEEEYPIEEEEVKQEED